MQRLDHHGQNTDQKNYPDDEQVLLDQDREQIDVNESLQLRGDDPVSELYIWGNDYYGQLGVGSDKVIHNLPKVCSFNIVVTDVSCGEEHTVFVQGDGGYVYAMGSNSEGRLGTGNPEMRSCNVPTLVDGLCSIKKVSCGTSHTLALSDDGVAYAWGQAFYGALGMRPNEQGSLENVFAPKIIPQESFANEPVKDLDAGSRHSIFVNNQNKVFGCGDANQGQLGLGDASKDRVTEPTQIVDALQGMTIYQISCGKYHTLLLTNNTKEGNRRELWAFGANNFGQIGNNSNQNQFSPVRVDPRIPEDKMSQSCRSHKFKQISTWHASAAVTEDGIMYVWGSGIFGEFKRPRKVKLQNNIRVKSVNVGGTFIVIVDQDNKIVVWGSNSNGEIGVGDQKVRNHPTRLETIEDKTISKVGVGGSFAFAIGKTTSRMENSIFEDGAQERSHISGIDRNGVSQIQEDTKEQENNRNNRSINSLEEQLQQIALHSASKQNSDECSQKPQDRSVGNYSNNAGTSKFEQAANRVSLQHSGKVETETALAAGEKSLQGQVDYLKQVVAEKERTINNLNEQSQQKHEDYQEKLHRFKEMQDQELGMSNKLREENKKLREENDSLNDQILEHKQSAHDARKNQTTPIERPYLPPGRQESGQSAPQNPPEMSAARLNYFPGVNSSIQTAQNKASSPQYQRGDSATPSSFAQNHQPAGASSSTAYPKYEPYQYKGSEDLGGNTNNLRSSLDSATGQSALPYRHAMDDINQREPVTTTLNDERFQQTYLRDEAATSGYGVKSSNAEEFNVPSADPSISSKQYRDNQQHYAQHQQYSREDGYNAGGKVESTYNQRYQAASRPGQQQNTSEYLDQNNKQERVSVDVDNMDRSPGSSAKKTHDFQRSNTADNPVSGGFMRSAGQPSQQFSSQLMMSRGVKDDYNNNLDSNHMRRTSQINSGEDSTFRGDNNQAMTSNFARKDDQNGQPRLNSAAAGYSRDRVNTGRVENLRSMGNDLMRPGSRDGPNNAANAPAEESAHYKMRNSSSGFYQPSSKYTRLSDDQAIDDYQHSQPQQPRRDTDEGRDQIGGADRGNYPAKMPEPSEIQNRLKIAMRYSQERSPDTNAKRSVTPNAAPQSYEPLGQSRVAYKTSYERITAEQKDSKESVSHGDGPGYQRFAQQHLPGKTDFANPNSSMPSSSQKEQYIKQRPGSGNGRDPLYQTQNNLQSMKYENLMNNSEGFSSKYAVDQNRASKNNDSPSKPPRNDMYRNLAQENQQEDQYASYAPQMANSQKYAFTPTANRTSTSDMISGGGQNLAGANEGKPPTYKVNDYQTRYSYDPLQNKDTGLKTFDGTSQMNAGSSSAIGGVTNSYRLSLDPVKPQPPGSVMGAGLTSSHTPSYSQHTAATNLVESGFTQQQTSYQRAADYAFENTNDQPHQRSSELYDANSKSLNSRLPERTSSFSGGYGGAHESALSAGYPQGDKARSPFTTQHLNEQVTQAQQPRADYTKLGGQSSFTPQDSGRRSSLVEQSSNNDGGEDIRTKLARYKKEREDFEVIRQNFRKKNSELGGSGTPGGGTNGSVYSENTPNAGSYKQGGDRTGGAENNGSNIFATEHSANQVQAFQAHVVTGGSPAFGKPEQSHSREH